MQTSDLDLIQELRLRQWARANYVPSDRRSSSWHPIVIDEMRCRDEESAERTEPTAPACRYVPLAPLLDAHRSTTAGDRRADLGSTGEGGAPHIYF